MTRKDWVVLLAIASIFTLIYFTFLLPFLRSNLISLQEITRFDFRENEYFEANQIKIFNKFRTERVVANDELSYDIVYKNKKNETIAIQPQLQIMHGGVIQKDIPNMPLVSIEAFESKPQSKIFFMDLIGENQVVLTAHILNTTDMSEIVAIQQTINVPVFSQEESIMLSNNETTNWGVILSILVAFGTISGLVVTSELSRRQLAEVREQNELIKQQMREAAEHRHSERKREHHTRLIEESISKWTYSPENKENRLLVLTADGSERPPFLDQALTHLEKYDEVWKVYVNGPKLVASKLENINEAKRLKEEILNTLEASFRTANLQFIYNNHRKLAEDFAPLIYGRLAASPKKGDPEFEWFPDSVGLPVSASGEYVVGGMGGIVIGDLTNTWEVAKAVGRILGDDNLKERASDIAHRQKELEKELRDNRSEFHRILNRDVIEKARLSHYEDLKGTCDDCPKPLQTNGSAEAANGNNK
jgi:hypothetical protein